MRKSGPPKTRSANAVIPDTLRDMVLRGTSSPMVAIKDFFIAEANAPWLELFGYDTRDEVVGRHIGDFLRPESLNTAIERMERRASGESIPPYITYEVVHKSGRILRVELIGVVWPADPSITFAIGGDITERDRTIEELKESERLYRTLAETIPAAVALTDRIGNNIYVNEQFAALSGYSRQEIMGGAWLLHPDEENALRIRSLASEQGTPGRDFETRFVRKDGAVIWISASWEPILSDSGEVFGFCNTFVDITEHRRIVEALREREARYRTLVGNIPGAVYRCAIDPECTVEFLSDAIQEICGYPASDFIDNAVRTYASIVHPLDRQMLEQAVAEAVSRKEPYSIEYRLIHADGSVRWVCERGQAHIAEGAEAERLDGVILDITARKNAEEAAAVSEERYRLLAENAPDILWQMDLSGRFTYVSPAVKRYGYEQEEWIGHHILEFLPPHEQAVFLERFESDTGATGTRQYEVEMLRKDGSLVWMEVSTSFVVVEGSPVRVQGISRDISERRRSDQALRESEERYRSIVEHTHELIMLTLPDGTISYLSPSCTEILGYEPDELVGARPSIFHPDDLQTVNDALRRALAGESCSNLEYRVMRKGGDTKWVSHSWSPIFADGRLVTVVSVVRDITEHREADETLKRAHADLEKAYNLQREFLNNVTHEVRTPLTAVQGYAEMLLEGIAGPVTDEQADLLRRVLASSHHLLDVVASVLELARLRSGTVALQPTACKPALILERALSSVTPQAARKGIDVRSNVSNGEHMGVYDSAKMAIILTNILSNAVKFTDAGSIEVAMAADGSGVEVVVADTGVGIRRRDLPTIFDEFGQLDFPGKHKPSGFGLGLAIVASMVDATGSTLTVSSRKGTGTAFTLYMPSLK